MSLQTRITDFITEVGTDYKGLRTWITGSTTGDLTGLTTTTKTSIVAAINELKSTAPPAPPQASETTTGISNVATNAETLAGTEDSHIVTPLKLSQKLTAWAQPLNSNLTSLASLANQTTYGRAFLTLANQAGLVALLPAASDTVSGISRNATQTETNAGTNDATAVTPLKFQTRLAAYAQPLNSNLTTLAGVVSGAFGRTLLGTADAAAAKTALGLATVATSGSAADLTGVLNTAQLPALAINDTFEASSQTAMLALTAQRGDIALRTDINRGFILAAEGASTLANWKQISGGSDVISVAGRTGLVVLNKSDVGLGSVDNTADSAKPVSTAQATAIALKMDKSNNLSDVASVSTARTNLGVYSTTEIGNPETDLVAAYTAAKA